MTQLAFHPPAGRGLLYPDLDWLLRAFAQPAEVQLGLYCHGMDVADDMATDFETAILREDAGYLDANPSVRALDRLLAEISGVYESWTNEALCTDPHWEKVRTAAQRILAERGQDLAPLLPLRITFVNVDSNPMNVDSGALKEKVLAGKISTPAKPKRKSSWRRWLGRK